MFTIRTRLALWYAAVLGLCLGGLGWFVSSYVARESARQIDAGLKDVATAFAQLWRSAATGAARPSTEEILNSARGENFEFVVFDESQREIASNSRSARLRRSRRLKGPAPAVDSLLLRPDLAPLFREAGAAGEAFVTLEGPLGAERAYAVTVPMPGRREIIAVIEGLDREERMLRALRRSLLLLIPLGLAATGLGGAFLAGRALRPVGAMAAQAERIEAHTLHDRLPVVNPGDELGQLAASFNRVLARLETSFERQRRFMAEASHELRTPIAVVRGEADLALTKDDRPAAEYREALQVVRDESRRMTRIVEDLFLLARADAGELPLARVPLDLAEVARNAIRSLQVIAAEREINLEAPSSGAVPASGDEALLRRLVTNLVDNAIKYGRRGGRVAVAVATGDGGPTLTVTDDGPGIPAEFQDRIFDRFFRGPGARGAEAGAETGGAGLGLAIARSVAAAHGGSLVLVRSGPEGTVFRLTLPEAAA